MNKRTNYERAKDLITFLARTFDTFPGAKNITDDKKEGLVKGWGAGIKDLTDKELHRGCEWCLNCNEQFAPSVARFRFHAKGLLDTMVAYIYANNEPSYHPVITETIKRIGSCTWRMSREDYQKKLFFAVYGKVCDDFLNGKLTSSPANTEEAKKTNGVSFSKKSINEKYCDVSTAHRYLAEIQNILKKNTVNSKKTLDNYI